MSLLRKFVFCLPVILCTIAGISFAAEPLNKDIIERWIQSQDEMVRWGKEHEKQIDFAGAGGFPTNTDEMLAPVKDAGLYDELSDLTGKYGFSRPEDWADASVRIIGAMGAIEMGDSMQELDIQKQLKEIDNSAGLSAGQKQQMKQMMEQSLQAVKQMSSASEADIAAVKPYLEQIEAATGAVR